MHHIIGLSTSQETERLWPLDPHDRIRFRSDCPQSFGYFSLIAPAFEKYAQRDAQIGITSMNVMLCLKSDDLENALAILNNIEIELYQQPTSWREYLGEVQYPKQKPQSIQPLLFKYRALRFVHMLRALVLKAQAQGKCLVYGNGVCYRSLRGMKLPPGVAEYS